MLLQMRLVVLRTIGRVGIDIARRIVGIEETDELGPVMRSGAGHRPCPDQTMPTVDADMVLVAEGGDHQIDYR